MTIALLLLALAPVPAVAAPAPPVAAATAAAPPASGLSDADRAQVLSVLKDPARLKSFTATLERMNRAVAATQPSGVATAAGLVPHSLGAEMLDGLGGLGGTLAAEVRGLGHVVHDFGAAGPWLRSISRDGPKRAGMLDVLARLALVLAVAAAVTYGVRRAIRRPIAALDRLARASPPPPPPEETAEAAETGGIEAGAIPPGPPVPALALPDPLPSAPAPSAHPPVAAGSDAVDEALRRRRHAVSYRRLLHALARLPLAAGRFGLELSAVLGFALGAALMQATGLLRTDEARIVVETSIRSFVFAGFGVALVNTVFAPRTPALRLFLVRDETARVVTSWLRAMLVVGAAGFAAIAVLQTLGIDNASALALTRMLALVEHVLLAGLIFRIRDAVRRRLRPPRRLDRLAGRAGRRLVRHWWQVAVFFDFAFWLVWAAQLRHGFARLWSFSLDTAAIVLVAWLVQVGVVGALSAFLRVDDDAVAAGDGARPAWLRARMRAYDPILRRLAVVAIWSATAVSLLQVWGFHAFTWFRGGALGGRMVSALLSILVASVIAAVVWEALNLAADRRIERLSRDEDTGPARIARLRTLLPILRITLFVFIATILLLTVLTQIGVNVAPLLGGAGILGVALGFGSQKLVQDFITGIFLLLENAMQVGDVVTAGGLSGTVEHLSIRTLRLRAGDGSMHIIPFSSVTTVTNNNRGMGNAAVSVDIDPREDTDRVSALLGEIVLGMRGDPAYSEGMLTDLQLWGVDRLTSQAVTLVGQIGCTDRARWGVQREFNRRLRIALEAEGIALAMPRQEVSTAPAAARPFAGGARPVDAPEDAHGDAQGDAHGDARDGPAEAAAAEPGAGAERALVESPPPSALGNTA